MATKKSVSGTSSKKDVLPSTVSDAAKSGVAATLGRAIASHLAINIDLKQFRDTLRRRHGYVSGKHGDASKVVLNDKVAADMLDHYASLKARRASK